MKEATGELNVTVITVVAIAAVAAFFYAFIWPAIKTQLLSTQVCNNAPGYSIGTAGEANYVSCEEDTDADGKYSCNYTDNKGNAGKVTCNIRTS